MIDMHTHILFGVDDGTKTIEDSLKLINEAKSIGINTIILTPHISSYRSYVKNDNELILKNFEILKDKVKDMELYLGYEIDYDNNLIENVKKYQINNTKYVLIDYTFTQEDLLESVYNMIVLGYIPIIAHPERHSEISFDDILNMKAQGAYIQVTSRSIKTKMGKKLLKRNLIDFVSTDIHRVGSYYHYLDSYNYVKKIKGKKYANKLFKDNPRKLIEGEKLDE